MYVIRDLFIPLILFSPLLLFFWLFISLEDGGIVVVVVVVVVVDGIEEVIIFSLCIWECYLIFGDGRSDYGDPAGEERSNQGDEIKNRIRFINKHK